jgi:hypothetical protein
MSSSTSPKNLSRSHACLTSEENGRARALAMPDHTLRYEWRMPLIAVQMSASVE